MKLPLALTVIILAAGSFWGVREQSSLTILRERHRQVVAEAAALGVSTDASNPFTPTKVSKREREDSTRKVKDFTDKLVAFAKLMEEMEKSGVEPDQEQQKSMMDMIDGMLSLGGDEFKMLIAGLRSRTDISDEMRRNMIGISLMMLAQQHPQTALALFTESSDLLEDNPMRQQMLSSALTHWAKEQPLAAVEWIRKNSGKHKELEKDEVKRAVVTGAARSDFALAFQLADELKLGINDGSMMYNMLASAQTPERKAELLAAIRKHASSMSDREQAGKFLKSGTMGLFSEISGSGFDKTMEWLKTTNMRDDEAIEAAHGLNYKHTKEDTGKWLDWLASRTADGKQTEDTTRDLIRQWTEQDYKAAGEWLAKSPAGPLKETAALSYLKTVAPYDPDVAAQWAATLPASKQPDAMKDIHQALEKKDKAAAEDFAKRHGITKP